jgi:hypothetical protein
MALSVPELRQSEPLSQLSEMENESCGHQKIIFQFSFLKNEGGLLTPISRLF